MCFSNLVVPQLGGGLIIYEVRLQYIKPAARHSEGGRGKYCPCSDLRSVASPSSTLLPGAGVGAGEALAGGGCCVHRSLDKSKRSSSANREGCSSIPEIRGAFCSPLRKAARLP